MGLCSSRYIFYWYVSRKSSIPTTSNSFDLLSENTENSLDANSVNVTSVEDNNSESCSNKSNTLSNTSISTEKKVNFRHNRKKQERKKDQIVTAIVGDSMVKDVYGWDIYAFQRIDNWRYDDMHQTSTEASPWLLYHPCRNDLRSNHDPQTIARNIVEVACNSKTDKNKSLISGIALFFFSIQAELLDVTLYGKRFFLC